MMFDKLVENHFEVFCTSHALAIIQHDFPEIIGELESALLSISLPISEIIGGGGGESKMTQRLRRGLAERKWVKHRFELTKSVDGIPKEAISHEIDHVRRHQNGVVAFEIEWNNKDPFFDRDLENFKRLHAEGAISFGGVVTRGSQMQVQMLSRVLEFGEARQIGSFDDLRLLDLSPTRAQQEQIAKQVTMGRPFYEAWAHKFVSDKYGQATTHWSKLMDRVARGVGNPCPLVLIGLPPEIIDMNA